MFPSVCDVVAENDVCQLENKTKQNTNFEIFTFKKKKKKRMGRKIDEGLKK